jgi:hypothetical protein
VQDLLPPLIWTLELVVLALTVVGAWLTLVKAGKRGWLVLVPVVNLAMLIKVARRPIAKWVVLLLLPGVNVIAIAPLSVALARRFGYGPAFGIGLAYAPFVFYPILGFGPSQAIGAKS